MAKKRVRDKEQKINKIIQASMKLFAKKGYPDVSTNHIAKDANVAIGTLYKYFPEGKSDILLNIFHKSVEQKIEETPLDNLKIKTIEDLRNSALYRKLLIDSIREHRQSRFMIEAFETEYLSNKKFYSKIQDQVFIESQLIDLLIKNIFQDKFEEIKKSTPDLMKVSRVKEVLIHRHVLFGDIFDSDEEFIDIILEIVITMFNYYLKKQE